jgi:hypothetical protein
VSVSLRDSGICERINDPSLKKICISHSGK